MTAGSAEAFAEELRRATTALGGIAEVLDEARASQQEAVQTRKGLQALRASGAERADRVLVGGRWRVLDGQIEGLDLDALIAAHRQAARQLVGG